MKLVPEDAVYDQTRNDMTQNQEVATQRIFAFIQELRRQKSLTDDSPGTLTAQEIIMAAFANAPGAAEAIVNLLGDQIGDEKDFSNVANAIKNQLFD